MNTTEIWIDALEFDTKGGWKEDTQFVHLMGSGYLIAADIPGVPVEDATVKVTIPQADTYRIWVRDRNWYRPHNPGTFNLLVNGENNGVVLGQMPSDAWVWEIAGDFELEAGETTLALHDLTGYFGRCASILITNDFDYTPPREIGRIHKDRARIKGLDYAVQEGGQYDVIVAGGGPGGVPAALAAARKGMKTLLIHNRPMLGGNGSSEVGITFDGAAIYNTYAREGGIAEELRRLRDRETESRGEWSRALEKLVAAEPNLTLRYNAHVSDVQMENESRIRGVTALDVHTLTRTGYTAEVFIDCTGDGWMGYYAGARYRFGREAEYQHGENLAPEIADTMTMSGCIRADHLPFLQVGETDSEYHAPDWVPKLPSDPAEFGRVINGNGTRMPWWLEAPNTYDDMNDGEQTRDALLMVMLGYLNHLKNHWKHKDRAAKLYLCFDSIFNGRRESRRFVGDYMLNQNDCSSARRFEDAVSYCGWTMDIHHPEGIYSGSKGPLYCAPRVHMATIPFRCLYSRNIENLMFAGRNISVTHIALGSTRVQNTIATLGQAVGTAAAMCVRLNETPRGICQNHIKTLQQQLLKDDLYIPGIKNEDPGDPCRTAEATASSIHSGEVFRNEHGIIGDWMPMNLARITRTGVSWKMGDIENFYLLLRSTSETSTTMTLHVRRMGSDIDTYSKPGPVLTTQAVVPPMSEGWVAFPLQVKLEPNKYQERCSFLIWLDAAEGISLRAVEKLTYHTASGVITEDGKKVMEAGRGYCISMVAPTETMANCAPKNVINGYSRIVDAEHYQWVSDPAQALPQWIALNFRTPAEINSVSLAFDTDLTNPGTCWGKKLPGVPVCVKDYAVEVFDGSAWITVAEVTDNFMRKRTHSFDTVNAQKMRVIVKGTWGDPSARIMEIRASLEA